MKKAMKRLFKEFKNNILIIIIISVFVACEVYELDYSIYSPGGLINVEERLENVQYKSSGSFNLTYVSSRKGTLANLLIAKILPGFDIIKNEEITIPDEDMIDSTNREKIQIKEAKSAAIYVSYMKANKDFDITNEDDYVYYVADKNNNELRVGDKFLRCDGNEVNDYDDIHNCVTKHKENEDVSFEVERDNKSVVVNSKTYKSDGEIIVGIVIKRIYDYRLDPEIKYSYEKNESGSSGGLMLALALYDSLVEEDITRGLKIAGTGTIDIDGSVGEIAGVKYKLAGAAKKKANIFIVPDENYDEAVKLKQDNNYDITIIGATSFDQVLNELKNYN